MNYSEKSYNSCNYFEFVSGSKLYILLSGWGTPFSLADMYNLAILLSSSSRVIVIDRLGYGENDDKVSERTFENVCFEISTILDRERNGEKATIIGHSLGGAYALFIAGRYPELVESIVSLDMLPYVGPFSSLVYGMSYIPTYTFRLLRKTGIVSLFKDSTLEKLLRLEKVPEEVAVRALIRTRKCLYNKCVINELKYMGSFIDEIKKGNTVCEIPVKFILSERSLKATKKTLPLINKRYSNVTIHNIGVSGHYVHHDKLNEVYAIVNE